MASISELESAYELAAARLAAIGPEPRKPSNEKPEHVARYDAEAYKAWKRKYSALKKKEVAAANDLFHARQEKSGGDAVTLVKANPLPYKVQAESLSGWHTVGEFVDDNWAKFFAESAAKRFGFTKMAWRVIK